MSAPLDFFTGAPLAQKQCATGRSALKGKPSGAKRATAPVPVAHSRSKLGLTLRSGRISRTDKIKINGGIK